MDNFRDSYFKVDWDLSQKRLKGTFWGKQYDTGRGFEVTVINGGQVLTATTEVLRLKWEKPDNTAGYVNATVVNGKFIIENIDQMFTVQGSVRADFELSVAGESLASITFYVSVEKAVAVDAIESSSEFTALQSAIAVADDLVGIRDEFNAVIANATADSEVILARGTEPTLGERLIKISNGTGIMDDAITPEKSSFVEPSTEQNIFNPYLTTDGYRLTTTGGLLADALYTISSYIPVVSGKTYKFITGGGNTSRICGYDSNKTFLKVVTSGLASGATALIDFNGYIRVPVLVGLKHTTQIVDNSIYNGRFTPFTYKLIDTIKAKPIVRSVLTESILDGAVTYQKTDFIVDGKNLFDKSRITANLLLENLVSEYYDTTDYINVKSGTAYTLNQARRYELYDLDKIRLGATVEKPDNSAVTVTPTQDGFIRASFSKSFIDTFQIEVGSSVTGYEAYERRSPGLAIDNSSVRFDSLKGKKLLNLGDSIAYGSDVSYAYQLAEKYGLILTNRAASGATVSNEIPANNIQLQLSQAIAANDNPDLILIDGGTNDLTYTIGNVTPDYITALNAASFCGGLESIFKSIRTTWPQAIIIYVVPHCMRKSLTAMADVFGKGVQIAKKYAVPVVNVYEEGNLNTNFIPQSTLYTVDTYSTGEGDGTHPNELGYAKFYMPLLEGKLKEVMTA